MQVEDHLLSVLFGYRTLFFLWKESANFHLVSGQHLSTYRPTYYNNHSKLTVNNYLNTVSNQCFVTQVATCGEMTVGTREEDSHMAGTHDPLLLSSRTTSLWCILHIGLPIRFYVILFLSKESFAVKKWSEFNPNCD